MQIGKFILYSLLTLFLNIALDAGSPVLNDYLNQIMQSFENQMEDELNLIFSGRGVDFEDKVEGFKVYLTARRRASLEEARTLQILAINKLVQIINNHKGIQPFLAKIPFTSKHIKISIDFNAPFGTYVDGSVKYVRNVNDAPSMPENAYHVFYDTIDPVTKNPTKILKEPFEEALHLAQAFPVNNPSVHQTTPLEEINSQVILKLGTELVEKQGIYLQSAGGDYTKNVVETMGAKFIRPTPTYLAEARKLILAAVETIANTINQEPRLVPYLKPKPFTMSELNVNIEFRDSYLGSFHDGSLDRVEFKNGIISYYLSPQKTKSVDVEWSGIEFGPTLLTKETYENALDIEEAKKWKKTSIVL